MDNAKKEFNHFRYFDQLLMHVIILMQLLEQSGMNLEHSIFQR